MSAVLGISANSHDAAAALFVDGELVAAMQEERFSRIKNDASLPIRAAKACLAFAGIEAAALDEVVFYENPYGKLERILRAGLRELPASLRQLPRALALQLSGKVWVLDALAARLGVDRNKLRFRDHHQSHAASAFLMSPFEKAAVLTVDAVGEEVTTALWLGEGTSVTCVEQIHYPHSLGLLYSALTAWLGFEVNEGEYKVMGLAAFGKPVFEAEMSKLISLQADGSFTLALEFFDSHTNTEVGFSKKLEALLGPRRAPELPWHLSERAEDRRFADVAASLQTTLERAMLGLARRAREKTGADALCLAGGVALNAVANAKLAAAGIFSQLFVQPAAGDAGAAIGAAALASVERTNRRPRAMTSAALGSLVSGRVAKQLAEALGLSTQVVSDVTSVAAQRLAAGEVVAWVNGRLEFGPRALGHRSLLALPTPIEVKERINRVIKRREPFRPFAPAVLESAAGGLFEPYATHLAPFMTTVATVRETARASLEAVTHADGTARLQTVNASTTFGSLLEKVGALTGQPVLLNTSLNGKGEPIVNTEADALAFFTTHPVDVMFIDDVMITR